MPRAAVLPDALRSATAMVVAGELPAALEVLRSALSGVAPDRAAPDPGLVDAGRLYAAVLACLGETYSAAPWSAYAHAAARTLEDPSGPLPLRADVVHAFVLRATGYLPASLTLYRDLVTRIQARYGPYARPALAGQADLAVALHAAGECVPARRAMHRAYFTHRDTFGPADEVGIRMLARLGAMTRDCGDFEKAHQYFDTAKALCARHLPEGHPLVATVTAAARGATDSGHVCGRPSTSGARADVRELFLGAFDLAGPVAAQPPAPASGSRRRAAVPAQRSSAEPVPPGRRAPATSAHQTGVPPARVSVDEPADPASARATFGRLGRGGAGHRGTRDDHRE